MNTSFRGLYSAGILVRFSESLTGWDRWNARKQTWKWNVSTFVIIHGVNVSVGFTPPRIDSIHYLTPILSARHFLLFLQTARNVNARFQWHVTNGNHVNSGREKKEITFARHEIQRGRGEENRHYPIFREMNYHFSFTLNYTYQFQ